MSAGKGRVILLGAGPGDPELLTLRGARWLGVADVVLHDELVSPALLSLAPARARLLNVGRRGHDGAPRSQAEVTAKLIECARRGDTVVRLKGGDPYLFGRGGEEASACAAAGLPFEVVPGISSAQGALAYAGFPVTDRRHATSFTVVSGHHDPTRAQTRSDFRAIATAVDTLVVLMGMRNLEEIAKNLLAGGRAPDTPAAAVMSATTPAQRSVVATLQALPAAAAAAGIGAPAVVVIGDVVRLRDELAWFEKLPLFGRRILLTRKPEQAGVWQRAFAAAGAEVVLRPMIQTSPVRDTPAIKDALAALEDYDLLLVTSANAVRELAACARSAGRPLARFGGGVFAVGEASARATAEAGLPRAQIEIAGPDAQGMLDALLARGAPCGQRVLLPRAEQGNTLLARGLEKAGARVDEVVVYRTEAAHFDAAALCAELEAGAFDVLAFASPSAVRNFAKSIGAAGVRAAGRATLAAIGPRTAAACGDAGLTPDIEAAQPEVASLLRALENHFADHSPEDSR